MKTHVRIPNDFEPRPYQQRFMDYLDFGGKRAMWVVHRRGGKDLTSLHQTCKMMHLRRGAYWHVYPTAEEGKKAIWEGFTKDGSRVLEQVFPKSIRKSPREFTPNGEMVVELKNGSMWRLLGSDRIEVVGAGPVGVVFSEYALARPRGWDFIAPMLRENGGWAAFITTPRGKNHAWELFKLAQKNPDWFCELQTLYDTRAYDPDLTIAEERAGGRPEALIRQEYLCDWAAAIVGSVYGDLLETAEHEGRLAAFEHGTDGVFSTWDLGIADSTALWLWRIGNGGYEFVDHIQAHGKPLSYYLDWLEARADTMGYRYVKHWLPHDGRNRSLQTGVSVLDLCAERFGRGMIAVCPRMSHADGIQAMRWLLQQKTRFHPRCGEGIEALRAYSYSYDEEKKTFSSVPFHDWSSHSSDAARYTALVIRFTELMRRTPVQKAQGPYAVPVDRSMSLDELWKQRGSQQHGGRI